MEAPTGQDPKRYLVKEIFRTVQGEGQLAGTPAVFLRLSACNLWSGRDEDRERDALRNNVACPRFCDTDFVGGRALYAEEILAECQGQGSLAEWVVVTGGEPLLQIDADLVLMLHRGGFLVAVETNGTVPLEKGFDVRDSRSLPDWITCSPKLPPEQTKLEFCHELKLVTPAYDPADWLASVRSFVQQTSHWKRGIPNRCLFVQPEDGPRFEEAVAVAERWVHEHPEWRLSVQTHKLLALP